MAEPGAALTAADVDSAALAITDTARAARIAAATSYQRWRDTHDTQSAAALATQTADATVTATTSHIAAAALHDAAAYLTQLAAGHRGAGTFIGAARALTQLAKQMTQEAQNA